MGEKRGYRRIFTHEVFERETGERAREGNSFQRKSFGRILARHVEIKFFK
jgi:hypothetical protein